MKVIAGIIAVVIVLGAGATGFVWLNARTFEDRIERLHKAVAVAQKTGPSTPDLPAMVRDFAMRNGGSPGGPGFIDIRQRASLYSAPGQAGLSLVAQQWTGTRVPGFVWRAEGAMMMMPVVAVDSYVSGEGLLEARVLGTVPVASAIGPDVDRGELMRYLAELPFSPDAILNASGLAWRQVDASHVEVSAISAGSPATVRFTFDEAGDIVEAWAADRPMLVDGRSVPAPWRGTFSDYARFGAYRIPSRSAVGWELPDGLFTYWTGEIVGYGPAPEAP